MFRAFSTRTPEADASTNVEASRRRSGAAAEHARVVERLDQLHDAIRMLDEAPDTKTASAFRGRYRENERRLSAECHRLERELELEEASRHGAIAIS
jgi:hypothetical protein